MYTGVGGVPAKDPDPGGGVPGPSESMYSSVSYISSPSLWKLWVFSSYRMPPSCAFVFLGFSRLSRSPNGETPAGWRAWRVLRVSRTYFPRGRVLPPGLTYLHPRSKPPLHCTAAGTRPDSGCLPLAFSGRFWPESELKSFRKPDRNAFRRRI